MRVLAQRPGGWQLGHAVLASRGMVAWIGAWTTLASAPAAGTSVPDPAAPNLSRSTTTSTPSTDPSAALSSLPNAGQLVAVLAQMALAHA